MQAISRRTLLSAGAAALLAKADPLGMPIGCQTWPVRDSIGKDFDGTLRNLASIGFRRIEMCSPPGYSGSGFAPLVGMKGAEMRRHIQDAGLGCESCHYGFRELKDNPDERIAFAKELGLTQMIVATFGLPQSATLTDWGRAADELNAIGERTQKAGIQLGFHNHDFEFHQIDGVLVYDDLMRRLDPKLVKMQFQVSVISLSYKAATYFEKYRGRFLSAHLADWSPAEKKQVPIGKGEVDWKELFLAAKGAGIQNYFVEMDLDLMRASMPYLHELKV